jgi:GWxTD domain-containing protein
MKKIIRYGYFLFCISFILFEFCGSAYCRQELSKPEQQKKNYAWDTMISSFSSIADPGKTFVEIYFYFLNGQFNFRKREDNNYYALIQFDVQVKNKEDSVLVKQSWPRVIQTDDVSKIESIPSLEITNFLIPPGNYELAITLSDRFENNSTAISSPFPVQRYPSSIMSLSDIELASNIKPAEEKNEFVKHNVLYVEPYPPRIYTDLNPILYFYCEVYNLGKPKNDKDTYTVECQIVNQRGEQVYRDFETVKKPNTDIALISKNMNVLKLHNDVYNLLVRVTDSGTGVTSAKRGLFSVYNRAETVTKQTSFTTKFEITPNNIQEYWNQIEYLATSVEKKAFNSYTYERKKQFIIDFWNTRGEDFYKEHMKRYRYAQEKFMVRTTPGWRTDRGRVYIMYGEPTNTEPHPNDAGMKPWEAWIYDSIKGQQVVFYFGDISEFGNYELLHCTMTGGTHSEIYDPSWQRRISR